MVFSSISFLLFFFPSVFILYFLIRNLKVRNALLLISSLVFYAYGNLYYIFLMIISIIMNYVFGVSIEKTRTKLGRKVLLALAVTANLSFLFVYKYLDFTLLIIGKVLKMHFEPFKFLLPIGISFYTFQALGYVVDVYRNDVKAEKNLFNLALYISFFPQLVAGPIVRYIDIANEIRSRNQTLEKVSRGFERLIIGLGKKVLIANILAKGVDGVYGLPFSEYSTLTSWVVAVGYALQIYYDFSGYSDMAIGLGGIFGFTFKENFNHPYASKSIREFWRRWHISLSSWFRDYLYIPLGGNRRGKKRQILNTFIVFFLTGLWHGAAVNFVLWGVGFAVLLTFETLFFRKERGIYESEKRESILKSAVSHVYTLIFVLLLWVIFRLGTKDSIIVLLKMFGVNYTRFTGNFKEFADFSPTLNMLLDKRFYLAFLVGTLFSVPFWRAKFIEKSRVIGRLKESFFFSRVLKAVFLILILVFSLSELATSSYNPFIYFRF